jgi:multiple sugar transport system substrate-binding protein
MSKAKVFLVFLSVVLLVTGLQVGAAGGQEEANGGYGPSGKPVKLTISIGSHGRFLVDETVQDFMSIYPNYEVEIVAVSSVPNEAFQTFSTMFTAQDDSLDIIGIDPSWPYHMARAGWIADLSELFVPGDQADLKDFNKAVFDTNVIDGKPYALPLYADALMLYYRKDLLDKYGFSPPTTWKELENQTRVILGGENDPNLSGYIYQARKIEGMTCNLVNFLSGVDGEILDAAGKVVLDDARGREAVDFMARLVEAGLSPKSIVTHNPNDDRIQFENGQAVFMNNWVFAMNSYQNPESPIYGKVGITRMVGKDEPGASCLGAVSISINNYSGKKLEAWEFVKFLTGYDWNKQRAMRAGLWSARESVWDDPEVLEANPSFAEIRKGASYLVARPTTRTQYYLKISDEIQIYLNQALAGQIDPQKAVSEAAESLRKILNQ